MEHLATRACNSHPILSYVEIYEGIIAVWADSLNPA